ncbi:MAG: winged helix-turn-helix transcriptional regulator [Nanoarchaeota archaeon]|nr:winged helix-turn-helix transcriptional regulator [Nanoarchaeota archaeon]
MKRNKLEIIKDILRIVQEYREVKITPLIRKSNISSKSFYEYYKELEEKHLVVKSAGKIKLTKKGFDYLEKYNKIVSFIEEFNL